MSFPATGSPDSPKTCLIVGAGPAGLTAALELCRARAGIRPVVIEMGKIPGGISRTEEYHGNRIDIGGHRFFSKSRWVTGWWDDILAMPEKNRISRIFFLRRFFSYPVSLSLATLRNLGLRRTVKVGFSYVYARLFPIRQEKTLEDFMVNRFGRELYRTFFRDYTEKVWGVPCHKISPDWGAQRIKGVSISAVLADALRKALHLKSAHQETSLIDRFLYPEKGPGQLWEKAAELVQSGGGELFYESRVEKVAKTAAGWAVTIRKTDGSAAELSGDFLLSTMPVKELIASLEGVAIPPEVREVAEGLTYRDFMTVGLLVERFADPVLKASGGTLPDNWIYIQERDVLVGRLQVFSNWSRGMVAREGCVWMGLEFFCNEGDELDSRSDDQMKTLAEAEMVKLGFIDRGSVLDSCVIRQKKAYPAYFGTYARFGVVQDFLGTLPGLIPMGRNGMHRYNNQDHSMLAAKAAVELILAGKASDPAARKTLWEINAEKEYHEEGAEKKSQRPSSG